MVVAGIFKEDVLVEVAVIGSAENDVDVLVAVVIEVGKGDPVAFLDVAEAAGEGRLLKALPASVAHHAVGEQ